MNRTEGRAAPLLWLRMLALLSSIMARNSTRRPPARRSAVQGTVHRSSTSGATPRCATAMSTAGSREPTPVLVLFPAQGAISRAASSNTSPRCRITKTSRRARRARKTRSASPSPAARYFVETNGGGTFGDQPAGFAVDPTIGALPRQCRRGAVSRGVVAAQMYGGSRPTAMSMAAAAAAYRTHRRHGEHRGRVGRRRCPS